MSQHDGDTRPAQPELTVAIRRSVPQESDDSQASAPELPHCCSALSRSIVQFCKFIMGGTGFSFQLPRPPTPEELQAWKEWVAERQTRIDAYITEHASVEGETGNETELSDSVREAVQRSPQAEQRSYQSAPRSADAPIPQFFKNRCDHEFQSQGFPRVTFEWNQPSLKTSQWNSATADILANQWNFWYHRHRLFATRRAPNVDVRAIIGRWMKYISKRPTKPYQTLDRTKEEMDLMEKERLKAADERRKRRTAVAQLRLKAFEAISSTKYREHLRQAICTDTTSDCEFDSDDPSCPPTRIIPFWRSEQLTRLLHMLDLAAFQQAHSARKNQVAASLVRKGEREANDEDYSAETVPCNLPHEAYSRQFLLDLSPLERLELNSQAPSKYNISIPEALSVLDQLTKHA